MRAITILFFTILWLSEPHVQSTANMRFAVPSQRGIARSMETVLPRIGGQTGDSAASQGPVQYANRGDVASGRIIREEKDELDLDTSPCNGDRVVRFHKPYEKSVIRQAKCGNQTYDRTQVEQK